jgi:hypothetical protein
LEIREVDYGVANNFGDYIEINKNLNDYPKLRRAILEHEFGHTNTKGFSGQDLAHDLSEVKVSNFELLKFMINNPKSFHQLLPIYKKDKTLFYDINMMIVWGVLFGIAGLSIFFALKF